MNIPKMKDVSDSGSPAGTGRESDNYASGLIGGAKGRDKGPPANSIDIVLRIQIGK